MVEFAQQYRRWHFKIPQWLHYSTCVVLLGASAAIALSASSAIAQITPDASLGTEASSVVPGGVTVNGLISDRIQGGALRNHLLFHSFADFNIATGQRVYFDNPAGISTIITRVTGSNPSQILGTLGVLGAANLLLINPRGIVFGANARLDLGGSFTASTANAILFDTGFVFSASDPQAPPLLTINTPIGLQWGQGAGANPATIVNQSRSTDSNGAIVGLQVNTGQSLSLIGGTLILEGGYLTAPMGQIELGSVASGSTVSLTPSGSALTPGYATVSTFQDIQLSQNAAVDASGTGAGSVHLAGRAITLSDRSKILADTLGNLDGIGVTINATSLQVDTGAFIAASSFGAGKAGDLTVQATQSINLTGAGFDRFQQVYVFGALLQTVQPSDRENGLFGTTSGSGAGGNITISTNNLSIRDGGTILGYVFKSGTGANLLLNAADIELSGGTVSVSGIKGGSGESGTIAINTDRLTIQDGGFIVSGTSGAGDGGKLVVNAADSVLIQRTPDGALFSSSIGTVTLAGAAGNGGDLTINTRQLTVRDGGAIGSSSGVNSRVSQPVFVGGQAGNLTVNATEQVEVSGVSNDGFFKSRLIGETYNNSAAGELRINTGRLIVQGGGEVSAAAYSSGRGGRVVINATQSVEVSGTGDNGRFKSDILASSGSQDYPTASGASGSLEIKTGTLSVRDGATVAVNSFGSGDAGELSITANSIKLDNQGSVIASTASGEGGNIRLYVRDVLQLRHNSLISAEAGGTGNGGNIDINAGFIVAIASENSDIIADAVRGRGGNINITARGIYGLTFRSQITPLSDITASSQFGINGVVSLNTPEFDPSRGTTTLPSRVVDSSKLIASSCATRRAQQGQGSFVITGLGGLPMQPDDLASSPFFTYDLIPASQPANAVRSPLSLDRPVQLTQPDSAQPIVEIDSIYRLSNGAIALGRSCD